MSHLHRFLSACLTLIFLGGCAIEKRDSAATDASAAAAAARSKTIPAPSESAEALLKNRLASRSREVGLLRLQLLAKQAEINQLLISHERAVQEAVRANARLRVLNSKADVVATIAEAALMIRNAKEIARDEQLQALGHAEKLLEKSRKEMLAGNLDAASYLAAKALGLAQAQTSDHISGNQTGMTESVFALPIGMMVTKQSNVRKMPGIGSAPLFQLAKGVRVQALGYSDLWIRINTEENGEGWIYYNLLEMIDPGAAVK